VDNNTYVHILTDTLTKKNILLDRLIQITLLQEEYITATPPDMDRFEQTILDKELLIEQLSQLDDGFEKIYDHVKEEISTKKIEYKDVILRLQELIKQVTEKGAKIQTMEMRNKSKVEVCFSSRKKEIKNFKMNSQTVTSYYKNMSDQHQGQSYFLDKKN